MARRRRRTRGQPCGELAPTRHGAGARRGGCRRAAGGRTARRAAAADAATRWRGLTEDSAPALQTKLADIDAKFPPPPRARRSRTSSITSTTPSRLIGIDHVGISSDFDGGGGVDGWNGADETFNVTLELVRRGYTEEQIAKIWSGNLLRVMEEVRQVALKSKP